MSAQPGWYADPSGDVSKLRFWDGVQWTDQYMDASAQVQAATNPVPSAQAVMAPGQIYPMSETDRTLRLIAFIWNILCTVGCAILILPLAWMIPMTVRSYGIYKGTKPNSTAFDVCTLLFVGLVSGILLLCSRKDV